MRVLEKKIQKEGRIIGEDILKVDNFLNHQIDPELMMAMGQEFAQLFEGQQIDKVLTIETSGIAPAMATALALNVPMVFAKKKKPNTLDGRVYTADVFSFTKQAVSPIMIDARFLHAGERVLLIDDFMAKGEAVKGLVNLVDQAGAELAGVGIVIEKAFQNGRDCLADRDVQIESLARISHFDAGKVFFAK